MSDDLGFNQPAKFDSLGLIWDKPVIIAGPCAIRNRDQALETAKFLLEKDIKFFRGFLFKPRTSPDSFQGIGFDGIPILEEIKALGMHIVTDVQDSSQLEKLVDVVDIFQVGARSMQNNQLLKALAGSGKPVILKRGLAATVEEWLQAAKYLTEGGNKNVILCERGIRTFTDFSRFTLDLNVVPYLRQKTSFPVLVDPSHGTGVRDLVTPMARAALSCGANGLVIEVDPDPSQALSDGFQSLDLEQFSRLLELI